MGPCEAIGIFESVAHQAIDTDVVDPDESDRQKRIGTGCQREEREHRRHHVRVHGVVNARAPTWPVEIAEHGEIGQKPEGGEHPPARTGARIQDEGECRDGQSLEAQESAYGALDREAGKGTFGHGRC